MLTDLNITCVTLKREVEDRALVQEINKLFATLGKSYKSAATTFPHLLELKYQLEKELRYDREDCSS